MGTARSGCQHRALIGVESWRYSDRSPLVLVAKAGAGGQLEQLHARVLRVAKSAEQARLLQRT